MFQFRRGSYPAGIHSLSFSPDASMLAVSSDTGTVHVFKLDSSSSSVIKYLKIVFFSVFIINIVEIVKKECLGLIWEVCIVSIFQRL